MPHPAVVRHGFKGIQKNVQERLLKPRSLPQNDGDRARLVEQLYLPVTQPVRGKVPSLDQQRVDIAGNAFRRAMNQSEQVLNNLIQTVCFPFNDAGVFFSLVRIRRALLDELRHALDGAERVPDLMGHACGKPPEARHPELLLQVLVHLPDAREVHEVDHETGCQSIHALQHRRGEAGDNMLSARGADPDLMGRISPAVAKPIKDDPLHVRTLHDPAADIGELPAEKVRRLPCKEPLRRRIDRRNPAVPVKGNDAP